MRRILYGTGVLLQALIITACSGGETEPTNGDAVVHNPEYGEWQDQSPPPLQFELVQTYGDESEEDGDGILFSGSYAGPVSDSEGNIYLIDTRNSRLMSFGPDGGLRWQAGQEGKGPGDIQRPRGLALKGQHLYFANVSGSRIDQFDLEGNFMDSYTPSSDDLSLLEVQGFLPDGKLVATSTLWGVAGRLVSVFEITDSLEMVSQFEINVMEDRDLGEGVATGAHVSIIDSLVVAADVDEYSFYYYTWDGRKVKTVTRNFDRLTGPGVYRTGNSVSIRDFGQLNAPLTLPGGYLLASCAWPENVDDPNEYVRRSRTGNPPAVRSSNSIDLFNRSGTLLYSIEREGYSPEIGRILTTDGEGHIYTRVSDPYPQVRKYAVKVKK